jgi:hypothetical protein
LEKKRIVCLARSATFIYQVRRILHICYHILFFSVFRLMRVCEACKEISGFTKLVIRCPSSTSLSYGIGELPKRNATRQDQKPCSYTEDIIFQLTSRLYHGRSSFYINLYHAFGGRYCPLHISHLRNEADAKSHENGLWTVP